MISLFGIARKSKNKLVYARFIWIHMAFRAC